MRDVRKLNRQPSPNFKPMRWLEKRVVFRGYSYPVKNLLLIGAAALFLISMSAYFLIAYQNNQADPNAALQKETRDLTGRIGRFMELPVGEQPTLATVTDQEKLKGQDFFAHAQNGDKLLVYSKAKKAILFRPSTGKIIEVSNLISGDSQSQPPADINPNPEN
jgi:hypothetical protein